MDDEITLFFRKILLWGEDLFRLAFIPTVRTLDKAIGRGRGFGECVFLTILTLAVANLVGILKNPVSVVVSSFAIMVLAVPVLLILYAAVVKSMIRNRRQAQKIHEDLFHIGALIFSAGILAGAPFSLLPDPFSLIVSCVVLAYFLLVVGTRALRRLLKNPLGQALGMNFAAVLLAIPLYILLWIFISLLSGSIRHTFQ